MTESDYLNLQDPMQVVQEWLAEASKNSPGPNPNAMTLATVDESGQPSSRVVLAKDVSSKGVVFYTNYNSRKAQELAKNPKASVNFHWDYLLKQIKICGVCEKTSRDQAVQYWQTRPRQSQISQFISQQSAIAENRNSLLELHAQATEKFANQEVPCPETWGGYLLVPEKIELWIADPNRLHDRYQYQRSGNSWLVQRLYP